MKKQAASCSASTTTMAIFFAQNFTKIHLGDCRLPGRNAMERARAVRPSPRQMPANLQIDAHCHINASLHRLKFSSAREAAATASAAMT